MPAHTGAMSLKKTSSYYNFIILLGVKGQANSCIIKNDVRNYCIKKGERSLIHYVISKFF